MNRYGFIVKDGEDYGVIFGEAVYFLRDGIETIDEDVEIGYKTLSIIEGYSFGINKIKKEWRIKDTGHKCCKHILATGKYRENFEKSLAPFLKCFK